MWIKESEKQKEKTLKQNEQYFRVKWTLNKSTSKCTIGEPEQKERRSDIL